VRNSSGLGWVGMGDEATNISGVDFFLSVFCINIVHKHIGRGGASEPND
jgi:hypothetical protein